MKSSILVVFCLLDHNESHLIDYFMIPVFHIFSPFAAGECMVSVVCINERCSSTHCLRG